MEDLNFEVKDANGNVIKCELLLSYSYNGNNYAIYTDNTYDNGELNLMASRVLNNNGALTLIDMNDDEQKIARLKIEEFLNK